jgi:hypothetical protein
MKRLMALVVSASLVVPASAWAKEKPSVSLERMGKWEVNYDDDSCHLMAEFGKGDERVFFKMTRVSHTDQFELTLFGNAFANRDLDLPVEIGFGDAGPSYKREGTSIVTGKEKIPGVVLGSLYLDGWSPRIGKDLAWMPHRVSPAIEAAITYIDVKPELRKRHRLQTGSLGPVMIAMRQCTDNLVRYWGYDPEVLRNLSRSVEPAGNPANWLKPKDFPNSPKSEIESGRLAFRLDISDAGQVTGCKVLYRTKSDIYTDQVCTALVQRAKFKPALDAQGKPVKSFYINRVLWLIMD